MTTVIIANHHRTQAVGCRIHVLRLVASSLQGLHDCQVTFRIVTLYLEGHGDLVSRLVTRITTAIMWVIGAINLLAKCP